MISRHKSSFAAKKQLAKRLMVRPSSLDRRKGWLILGHVHFRCALGRNGIAVKRLEGDGATPRGHWTLRELFYRADRICPPETALRKRPIRRNYQWCDDEAHRCYNRLQQVDAAKSVECLWRDDDLYDLCVVIGFNDAPILPGRGSAIFLHLARPGMTPTEGCIAVDKTALVTILSRCGPETIIDIRN